MEVVSKIYLHFGEVRPIIKVQRQAASSAPYVLTIEEIAKTSVTMFFNSLEELEHIQDALIEGIERLKK